jgi:hypothetical protein
MFVSRGRYLDMRERALRAEALLENAMFHLSEKQVTFSDRVIDIDVSKVASLKESDDTPTHFDYPLPPPVEEAIRKRTTHGSPLEAEMIDRARTAIETMGSDFDADEYARSITEGTRIPGWMM